MTTSLKLLLLILRMYILYNHLLNFLENESISSFGLSSVETLINRYGIHFKQAEWGQVCEMMGFYLCYLFDQTTKVKTLKQKK